jgi:hypothetical protein
VASFRQTAENRRSFLAGKLAPFEALSGHRLQIALRIIELPEMTSRIKECASQRAQVNKFFPLLRLLTGLMPSFLEVRNTRAALAGLCSCLPDEGMASDSLVAAIKLQMSMAYAAQSHVHMSISNETYPFDHARGQISLVEYATTRQPHPEDLAALLTVGDELLDALPIVYGRLLGRLCAVAEQVEAAVGLPPLPEMPEDDEE